VNAHRWGPLLEVAWWMAACTGIWLLTLSSVSWPDLALAAACGLPCAVAARAGRRAVGGSWRPRLGWLAWLGPLAAAIPADLARLFLLAVRPSLAHPGGDAPSGQFRQVRTPEGEPAPVASARHALGTLTISATPGAFVVDSDPAAGTLDLHDLGSGWPPLDQVVTR
jgi:hypothetical protein